jgi:hypothetical protein
MKMKRRKRERREGGLEQPSDYVLLSSTFFS